MTVDDVGPLLKLSYLSRIDKRGRVILRKEIRQSMGMPNGGVVRFHSNESRGLIISPAKADHD